MADDRQARIDRIRRIERIKQLESSSEVGDQEPMTPAGPNDVAGWRLGAGDVANPLQIITPKEAVESPYASIAKRFNAPPFVQGVAGTIDNATMAGPKTLRNGIVTAGRGIGNAPDFKTAAAEVAHGALQMGMGIGMTAFPAVPAVFGGVTGAVSELSTGAGDAINAVSNPFTSAIQPETRFGQALTGIGDLAIQGVGFKAGSAIKGKISPPPVTPIMRKAQNAKHLKTAVDDLGSVIKPSGKTGKLFPEQVAGAAQYLKKAHEENPISENKVDLETGMNVPVAQQAANVTRLAINNLIEEVKTRPLEKFGDVKVDASPVMQLVIEKSSNPYNAKHGNVLRRDADAKIAEYAKTFETTKTLAEIDADIAAINKNDKVVSYFNAPKWKKIEMVANDPLLKAELSAKEALTDLMFSKFNEMNVEGIPEARKALSNLIDLERGLSSKVNPLETKKGKIKSAAGSAMRGAAGIVLSMHSPAATAVGIGSGIGRYLYNSANTPNARIKRAFESFSKMDFSDGNSVVIPENPILNPYKPSERVQLLEEATALNIPNAKLYDNGTLANKINEVKNPQPQADPVDPIPVEQAPPPFVNPNKKAPWEKFEESRAKKKLSIYNADPDIDPVLGNLGRGRVNAEWVIDKHTGNIVLSEEYRDIPKYFLNLKRPKKNDVLSKGRAPSPGNPLNNSDLLLERLGIKEDFNHIGDAIRDAIDGYNWKRMSQRDDSAPF